MQQLDRIYLLPVHEIQLAKIFHEIYEQVAIDQGRSTQNKTKVPFEKLQQVSPENYATMIETCKRVIFNLGLIRAQNAHLMYENIDQSGIQIHAG